MPQLDLCDYRLNISVFTALFEKHRENWNHDSILYG